MPRKQYTKEPPRCSCMAPADSAEIHHRPKNQAGDHLNIDCKHSEFYNTMVRYPTMIEAQEVERQKKQNRNRKKIRRVEL